MHSEHRYNGLILCMHNRQACSFKTISHRFLRHVRFCCCIDIRFSIAARNASIIQLDHTHHHHDVPSGCELWADWVPNCQPTPTKYLAPPLCNLLCDASSWWHVSEAQ